MAAAGALDFGDLIFRLVDSMQKTPELRADVAGRFSHVLVDEYQDTNRVQHLLLRLLCEGHRNLCVVGDDDQSIYRFRGADRRNILEFTRQFPDAHLIQLEQNYRSTQRILRVANAVVSRNLDRQAKTLWTENDEGGRIAVLACADERDEAATLVKLMQMLLEAGHARSEIALLYRTHAQSRVFEEALRFVNLPYRVVGGLRFYDRAEIKDLLAYLRVIHNADDDVSLLRVINVPARGIGKTTIERLLDRAAHAGTSVWAALAEVERDPAQTAAARKSLGRFRELMTMLRSLPGEGHGPSGIAHAVLAHTGYSDALRHEDSVEADARLENIQEVLGSMIEFEREAQEPTLSAFLELVTLQTDVDRVDAEDSITLMTVHAAKGLEFPAVMVAGLEEETFPHHGLSPEDDPDELEEERRLAYVAFTRAKQRLFVSHAHTRRVYGELKARRPSRFLREMPEAELERIGAGVPSASARAAAMRPGYRPSEPPTRARLPAGESYVDPYEGAEGSELRLGMRVRHMKFGVGQVLGISPGVPPRVTVHFPGWGDKTLVSSYLEPA
jgi:DNA helicase-2/ATP-dependent DNA helicase PcrA